MFWCLYGVFECTDLVQHYGSVPADSNMIHLIEAKGYCFP